MNITLDKSRGLVRFQWPRPVTLAVPTCRTWATIFDHSVTVSNGDAVDLTVSVLQTLCDVPVPANRGSWPLWLFDPSIVPQMLAHWRDYPVGPFQQGGSSTIPERFASLSPGTFALISLYRACRQIASPLQVDEMTMWQVGALLDIEGVDETDRPESPDVTSKYHSVIHRPDGQVASETWTRNPDAPPLYANAQWGTMPDLRSTQPAQTGETPT